MCKEEECNGEAVWHVTNANKMYDLGCMARTGLRFLSETAGHSRSGHLPHHCISPLPFDAKYQRSEAVGVHMHRRACIEEVKRCGAPLRFPKVPGNWGAKKWWRKRRALH